MEDPAQKRKCRKLICLTSRYVEPAAVDATSFFEVSSEFEEIAGTGDGATVPKAVTSNSNEISNTLPRPS